MAVRKSLINQICQINLYDWERLKDFIDYHFYNEETKTKKSTFIKFENIEESLKRGGFPLHIYDDTKVEE